MRDKIWTWIASVMPKSLVYFCAVRLVVFATTGQYISTNVPKLTAMRALKRWESRGKEDKPRARKPRKPRGMTTIAVHID